MTLAAGADLKSTNRYGGTALSQRRTTATWRRCASC